MFDLFLIIPLIITIVAAVVFVTVFIIISKAIKKSNVWNMAKKHIKDASVATKEYLSNNIFNQDENVVCGYCESVLPKGTTKCPHCSASIKKKN